jgi:two-component system copper resistance phosphate regulon response regulator CusR
MYAKTILLAEGEKIVADHLCEILDAANYKVDFALNGSMAKQLFDAYNYDLALVDQHLPDIDGFELCHYIRYQDDQIPLMMLSSGFEENKLESFQAGVDDYLVLTDDSRELLMRIKVLTRRSSQTMKRKNRIAAGDIVVDLDSKEVMRAGRPIPLSAKEFLLLHYLIRNKDKVVSRMEIASNIWAPGFGDKEHRVAALMNSLRNKIEVGYEEKSILTVTGKGYLLIEKVHREGHSYN